jgi:hypothetical protein
MHQPLSKKPVHLPAQAGVIGVVKSVRGDGSIFKDVGEHAVDEVRFKASLGVEMEQVGPKAWQ